MKNLYLDTNIIISYLKKDDIFYNFSNKIMKEGNFERFGSAITLLEIASVISRQINNIEFDKEKIKNWKELNISEKRLFLFSYFITKIPIKFYFNSNIETYYIKNQNLNININFSKALRISPFFSLRALDNLQISAALNIRDLTNIRLDYFVTTDKLILDNAKKIQDLTNLTIIHSEKLIEIENI
ncbi:MAG: PIN domain-containing protein [Candidatus Helarchaeota archaeon]